MTTLNSLISSPRPVLIDFIKDRNDACNAMNPILETAKGIVGDCATIIKINIDKNPDLVRLYNLHAFPTLILFKDGKLIWRQNGIVAGGELVKQLIHNC